MKQLRLHLLEDSSLLILFVCLSALPYVASLGFYCDDWRFLGWYTVSPHQTFAGYCVEPFSTPTRMLIRPMQVFYLAGLYSLFGLNPLGYHVVNTLMLAATAVAFLLVLTELQLPRHLAFGIPLVYSLLPNYSTDRFWYATFQANLSMAGYALGFYLALSALRKRNDRFYVWTLLSILALAVSSLAHELVLPLFCLTIVTVWLRGQRLGVSYSKLLLLNLAMSSLLLAVTGFKFIVAHWLLHEGHNIYQIKWTLVHIFDIKGNYYHSPYGFKLLRALQVNYVELGLYLPRAVYRLTSMNSLWFELCISAGIAITAFWYVTRIFAAGSATYFRTFAAGFAVFIGGYAIFLTTSDIQLTTTGMGNRVNIAATAGVAMTFVSALGAITGLLRSERYRRLAFAFLVSVLCFCGCFVTNGIASYWVIASQRQHAVLNSIRSQIMHLEPGTTLLLDGVCPYVGPAPVFECDWDFTGALTVLYPNRSLKGDVLKNHTKFLPSGVRTAWYFMPNTYPYGEKLLIYDYVNKELYPLLNSSARRPSALEGCVCRDELEGFGVKIF
jgi:hypothetical protein